MNAIEARNDDAARTMPRGLRLGTALLIAAGVAGLVGGLATNPARAWQAYLVNYLFFLGVGAGGVMFSCMLNLSSGRWGRPVKRVAEGLGAFLPVSLLLFLGLIPGLPEIVPWIRRPFGPPWWNIRWFLIVRELAVVVILNGLGAAVVGATLRVEAGRRAEQRGDGHGWLSRGWRGAAEETARARRRLQRLSVAYALAFAITLTVVGMDFIMSLKDRWISSLIGGYFFVASFYISLATLLLAVVWTRRRFGLHQQIQGRHLADVAKLTMTFAIVTAYFFYAQLLVIWYGNMPDETSFVRDRMAGTPWLYLSWGVMLVAFFMPIVALLNRKIKERPAWMVPFASLTLIAMWWAHYLAVGPTITGKEHILFGPIEIAVTAGFAGLLTLAFAFFMHRVPPIIEVDPALDPAEERT